MGIEQRRESYTQVDRSAEIRARLEAERRREASRKAATATYQEEATPLSERQREVIQERDVGEARSRAAGAATAARVARRQGDEAKAGKYESMIKAADVSSNAEAEALARKELLAQGFTEDQLDTSYGELGGTSSTGFLPPNVVGGGGGGAAEPVMVDGVLMSPAAAARKQGKLVGRSAIGGILFFVSLVSFALAVKDG